MNFWFSYPFPPNAGVTNTLVYGVPEIQALTSSMLGKPFLMELHPQPLNASVQEMTGRRPADRPKSPSLLRSVDGWYCLSWRAVQRHPGPALRELTVDFGVR